jgi:catechol 2,3-dioxygenase-like lactoylglutathione lyase family enzyme
MIKYIKFAQLPVTDQDRALAFYKNKLGFEVAQDRPFQGDLRWIELSIPGARTRLWFSQRLDDTPSTVPSLILMTQDVDSSYRSLAAQDVEFAQVPTDAPWNPGERFALFRDSEGNLVMLGRQDD